MSARFECLREISSYSYESKNVNRFSMSHRWPFRVRWSSNPFITLAIVQITIKFPKGKNQLLSDDSNEWHFRGYFRLVFVP